MRKISADYIFPISSAPIKNGIIVINDSGKIVNLLSSSSGLEDVEKYEGIICPGFINTHCHLELSHMKGIVSEGKGLVPFIKELMSQRAADSDFVQQCIKDAEAEMMANGIVAVGDISNGSDTFSQKAKRNLHYHTFIELYGFLDNQADEAFENGRVLGSKLEKQNSIYSLVPHSPYSTSQQLWEKICQWNIENKGILTFHNEETEDENKLFLDGSGSLIELMKWFGLDTSFWKSTGNTSLNSIKGLLPKNTKTLLVHNTMTTVKELSSLNMELESPYWCLCPNANWYIERKLPNLDNFIKTGSKITLGTDSLSSNWRLSILSEMQCIKKHYPEIRTATMLSWGTQNGAELLGIESNFGTLEKGKSPGIILITNSNNGEITGSSQVVKLI